MSRLSKIINKEIQINGIRHWVDYGTGNGSNVMELYWNIPDVNKYAYDILDQYGENLSSEWVKIPEKKVFEIPRPNLITLLDVIEHVDKISGHELIKKLMQNFDHIIIFTPNGYLQQDDRTHPGINKYQVHVSGWNVEDFRQYGMNIMLLPGFHNPQGHNKRFDAIISWS